MFEIIPGQVTPQFKSLFKHDVPTALRSFAVLAGGNAGRIFTDNLEYPRSGYVWEQDDGCLYQGGLRDWQVVAQIVELLRHEGTVALGFRDGDPEVQFFPPSPEAGAECIELDRPVRGSDLSDYLSPSAGYEVFRMGRDLIEKSAHADATIARYGSIDSFLKFGLGVCILHGDEYVCQASADMDIGGVREIGIFTEREYWGQGLGTIAVAHLLKWCDELSCATYWDCVKLNIRSLKIARKLGFTHERSYKLLAWFPPKREIGIR
jgi:RimJ/RimL family protein N-acetyltransferase